MERKLGRKGGDEQATQVGLEGGHFKSNQPSIADAQSFSACSDLRPAGVQRTKRGEESD